ADPAKAVSTKVKDKNKSVTKMVTVDRKLRDITVLEEAGIYQLIFSSKLPAAEKFQDWVFEEVLPSIRKTGSYSASKQKLGAYTQRVEAMFDAANKVPDGYWCVLQLLLLLGSRCLDLEQYICWRLDTGGCRSWPLGVVPCLICMHQRFPPRSVFNCIVG
ncbi:MAG: Bro-N domain-containing protein, partial [Dolichospermum sp.]